MSCRVCLANSISDWSALKKSSKLVSWEQQQAQSLRVQTAATITGACVVNATDTADKQQCLEDGTGDQAKLV